MIEAMILLVSITLGVLIQLRRERRKNRDRIEARREEIEREQRRAGMRKG